MTAAERVAEVRGRIEAAARRAGRGADEIELIAVSKTHSVEAILAVAEAGVGVFGENRVQEAETKIPRLSGFRWHFIGRLQRNKARKAVELFEMIHSVDSIRLGRTLARLGRERNRPVEGLIEVNLGGEESKGGVDPEDLEALVEALTIEEGLRIRGLMTVPPFAEDPEESRPYFRQLAELSRQVEARGVPGVSLEHLSMGMSADFEVAIEEGATMIRVGTALFGPRQR